MDELNLAKTKKGLRQNLLINLSRFYINPTLFYNKASKLSAYVCFGATPTCFPTTSPL
jgi:hypothetical protein